MQVTDEVGEGLARIGLASLARVQQRDGGPRRCIAGKVANFLQERRLRLRLAAEAGKAIPAQVVQVLQRRDVAGARPGGQIELGERARVVAAVVARARNHEVRNPPQRVLRERRPRLPLRGIQIALDQRNPGQVLVGAGRARVPRRFRVFARLLVVADLEVVVRERHHDLGIERRELRRLQERREGFVLLPELHARLAVHLPHVRHAGLVLQQLAEHGDGLRVAPALQCAEALLELRDGPDAVAGRGKVLLRPIGRGCADVAERGELLHLLGVGVARRLERPGHARELSAHRAESRRQARREVVLLARIGSEIVELGARRLDVVVAVVHERGEIAPAEMEPRVERLAVDPPRLGGRSGAGRAERADERAARETHRGRNAEDLRHGRKDVHEPDRSANGLAPARRFRKLHDQGDVDRLPVDQHSMLVLAVVIQPFAMVREEDDQSAVVDAALLEELQEGSDDLVGPRDLAVVVQLVPGEIRLGGLVGRMRLEKMQKSEERLTRMPRDPLRQQRLRVVAAALHPRDGLADPGGLDVVLVKVEPPRDSRRMRQNDRRDGATGRVALLLERAGDRRRPEPERVSKVVAHAVLRGQQSRHDRRVRGQRQRDLRIGVLEEHRVLAKRIQVRRVDGPVAVRGQVIGAQRVHGNEDHRSAGRDEIAPPAATVGLEKDHCRQKDGPGPARDRPKRFC